MKRRRRFRDHGKEQTGEKTVFFTEPHVTVTIRNERNRQFGFRIGGDNEFRCRRRMYRERKNRIIQLNVKRKSFLLFRVIDGFDGRGQRLFVKRQTGIKFRAELRFSMRMKLGRLCSFLQLDRVNPKCRCAGGFPPVSPDEFRDECTAVLCGESALIAFPFRSRVDKRGIDEPLFRPVFRDHGAAKPQRTAALCVPRKSICVIFF